MDDAEDSPRDPLDVILDVLNNTGEAAIVAEEKSMRLGFRQDLHELRQMWNDKRSLNDPFSEDGSWIIYGPGDSPLSRKEKIYYSGDIYEDDWNKHWEFFLHWIGAYDKTRQHGGALYTLGLIARFVAGVEFESLIEEPPKTEFFICPECDDAIVDPVPGEDYVRCDDGNCASPGTRTSSSSQRARFPGVCGSCDSQGLHDSSHEMQDGSIKYLCTKCNQEDLSTGE